MKPFLKTRNRIKYRIRYRVLLCRAAQGIALLLSAVICGCGKGAEISSDGKEGEELKSQSVEEQTSVYDLMEEDWAAARTQGEAASWNVADCLEVSLPDTADADFSYYFSAVDGSCYYVLEDLVTERGESFEHTLYWTATDVRSMESVLEKWELQAAEGAGNEVESLLEAFGDNRAWINGMDLWEGGVFLFLQQRDPQGQTIHYYKALADREGRVEELLDLLPALREGKILPEDNMQLPGGRCDGAGRCYIGDGTLGRVGVIDRDGSLVTVLEAPGGTEIPLNYMGKLRDGRPLYACGDSQEQSLAVLGYDGQEKKVLYQGEYELLRNCLICSDGGIVYGKNGKLLRWDVLQGVYEHLYDGKNLNFMNCDGMLEGAEGEVYAVFRQEDGTFIYGFTDRTVETVAIRMEQLTWGNDYIESCVSEYMRRHPGVVIETTERQENTESQQSRVMARLSQGEGPDLLLVNRQQLLAFQREGALAELSAVLTAAEREQIFPAVLEKGRIEDGLYGIACDATFSTLLVSDQVWQGDTWSLQDVLGIVEERERAGNPVEWYSDSSYGGKGASAMLNDLVLANLGRTSLVDLEAGKCYFDTEEFCRVLELCRRCEQTAQDSAGLTEEEIVKRFLEGKILAFKAEGNLMGVSRKLALLGEGVHGVGYPTEGKTGHLAMAYDGCVAVNASGEHREIAEDFLRSLVDYKSQRQHSTGWVREDVLRDCVKEQVELYNFPAPVPVFRHGDRSVTVLEGKPDGSSYLTEFLEVAEDSIPYETELDRVRDMVREEADACFAGHKEVEDTARTIQKRVQMYLDETK